MVIELRFAHPCNRASVEIVLQATRWPGDSSGPRIFMQNLCEYGMFNVENVPSITQRIWRNDPEANGCMKFRTTIQWNVLLGYRFCFFTNTVNIFVALTVSHTRILSWACECVSDVLVFALLFLAFIWQNSGVDNSFQRKCVPRVKLEMSHWSLVILHCISPVLCQLYSVSCLIPESCTVRQPACWCHPSDYFNL